jgi:hypothetical protein
VTFRNLQKLIQSQGRGQSKALQRLQDKLFWINDPIKHKSRDRVTKGACCFNHIVGLPKKDGKRKPMFDYETMLYRSLLQPGYLNSGTGSGPGNMLHTFKEKHLWVKKATGLGVTEFMLRFMAWLCLRNDDYRNSQMEIVTGPNQELAIKLIKRMKALFEPLNIFWANKETLFELNGCSIEAYPSNHIDAFRSLTNPKFILIEEGDLLMSQSQQEETLTTEDLLYLKLTIAYFTADSIVSYNRSRLNCENPQ